MYTTKQSDNRAIGCAAQDIRAARAIRAVVLLGFRHRAEHLRCLRAVVRKTAIHDAAQDNNLFGCGAWMWCVDARGECVRMVLKQR